MDAQKENLPAMVGDILHFAQAFFLEFRVSLRAVALSESETDGKNLVQNQNLVCAPPGLQSPAGLPAAAYLGVPSASVQAPNVLQPRTPAAHTSPILRYGSSFPRTRCHQRFTSCASDPVPTSPRR